LAPLSVAEATIFGVWISVKPGLVDLRAARRLRGRDDRPCHLQNRLRAQLREALALRGVVDDDLAHPATVAQDQEADLAEAALGCSQPASRTRSPTCSGSSRVRIRRIGRHLGSS